MTDQSTRAEVVTWLVGEMSDLLDAGSVGLYEFIWTVRQEHPTMSPVAQREIAAAALDQLLADGDVRLVSLLWAEAQPVGSASRDDVTDAAWQDIGDGPYLGIRRDEA